MKLKTKIFVRNILFTIFLLLLIVIMHAVYVMHIQHRQLNKIYSTQIIVYSAQLEELILRNDRSLVTKMLKLIVEQDDTLIYAFVEKDGRPYAWTFYDSVPQKLFGKVASPTPRLWRVKNMNDDSFDDLFVQVGDTNAVLHIGLSLRKVYLSTASLLKWIVVTGLGTCFLAILLSLLHSIQTTREIENATVALRESEKKFRILFQDSRDAIMTLAPPTWKFTSGNPATVEMFGAKNEDDFTSHTPWKYSPEYQPDGQKSENKARAMIEQAVKEGSHFFNWTHKRLNGELFPASVLLTRVELENSMFLQATVRDTTKQKMAEERYKTLFETCPDGIIIAEMESKQLRYVNPAICSMLGYSEKEMTSMNVSDIHSKRELKHILATFQLQAEGGKILAENIPCSRKDGTTLYMDIHSAKIKFGDTKYLLGFFRDITNRKESEQKQKQLAHDLGERVKEQTCLYAVGEILRSFDNLENIFQNIVRLLPPAWQFPDITRGRITFKKSIYVSEPFEDTPWRQSENITVNNLACGSIEIFYSEERPEFDEGPFLIEERRLIKTIANMLSNHIEHEFMERELKTTQQLKNIGLLAGGIAHDFNNLLTGVFGNISLAKNKLTKDHPGFKFLEKAGTAMDMATHLTSQLLTFSKGGAPVRKGVSIGKIIEETAQFDLTGSNIQLVFKQEENLWKAHVDKEQMRQVFSNLTINARKAMPNGGHLYIDLKNSKVPENNIYGLKQGKYIYATVRDEGVGIPQEHIELIFHPYFTTGQTGNGLGLAIVHSIMEKHDGHICVESELNKGTCFTLFMPIIESDEIPKSKEKHVVATPPIDKEIRILFMDDEEIICELITDIFNNIKIPVKTVTDGKDAVEAYKNSLNSGKPFDVVIMDLTIPGGMGGKEAVKKILKLNPDAKCIVSSGYTNDRVIADYTKYGFKAIIEKPFTSAKLQEILNRVIGKK